MLATQPIMPALFITFEGIDGCGKSTQIKRLSENLTDRALPFVLSREPGGTVIGEQIRRIILSRSNEALVSTAELMLYAADRAQHVRETLRPALEAGKMVLCDRYCDATIAYQGYGRGLSLELIDLLNGAATEGLTPDLTLLYDLPVDVGQSRIGGRGEAGDRLDIETREFYERVRNGYLKLAEKFSDRYMIISADASEDAVFEQTLAAINKIL